MGSRRTSRERSCGVHAELGEPIFELLLQRKSMNGGRENTVSNSAFTARSTSTLDQWSWTTFLRSVVDDFE